MSDEQESPRSAIEQLQANILAEFERFEQAHRAEIIAAGGNPDGNLTEEGEDPLSRSYLEWVAKSYTRARHAAEQGDQAAHDRMIDQLADTLAEDLTLKDTRILRVAAEAAVAATPRIIMDAADLGMQPPQIAAEVGLTPSRVYGILRAERKKRATALVEYAVKADADGGGDPRAALARFAAAVADVPEEHREAAEQYIESLRLAVATDQTQQSNDQ